MSQERHVNDLLQHLRGSQIASARRRQGLGPPVPLTYAPSLPTSINADTQGESATTRSRSRSRGAATGTSELLRPPSGPKPPPSWKKIKPSVESAVPNYPRLPRESCEWRWRALDGVLNPSERFECGGAVPIPIPSLQALCLRVIVLEDLPSLWPGDFVSSLPSHIRQRLGLEAAIWNPLSSSVLQELYGRHDTHRIIVVGQDAPTPTRHPWETSSSGPRKQSKETAFARGVNWRATGPLLRELLHQLPTPTSAANGGGEDDHLEDAWDADSFTAESTLMSEDDSALTSLALMQLYIPASIPPLFPHTLTRLSLVSVALSSPRGSLLKDSLTQLPLHLLSRTLPRLIYLDISFNTLDPELVESGVEWATRWVELKTMGLRDCVWEGLYPKLDPGLPRRINAKRPGRWIHFET